MLEKSCNKEDCIYRSVNSGSFITCDYILIEKRARGCPIGDECTKYTPGIKHHDWMENFKIESSNQNQISEGVDDEIN